jgi:cytochrome c peroxidase
MLQSAQYQTLMHKIFIALVIFSLAGVAWSRSEFEISALTQLGLPVLKTPDDNPLSSAKIALGKKLFFDPRLSLTDNLSCAMCHIPAQGFTNNHMATSVGITGKTGRRNAPTILNSGFLQRLFHDGREYTLEQQAWGPLLDHNEMGNPSIGFVIHKIKSLNDYQELFEQAFNKPVTMETLGMAIASYERTLIAANSPFDRWYYQQQENAISPAAKKGFRLFTGKAGCSSCHLVNKQYALFTDDKLHNTGIGYQQFSTKAPLSNQKTIFSWISMQAPVDKITRLPRPGANDQGLYEITLNPDDLWRYKTPTLRNIAKTAPYMHNGQMHCLEEIVRFYNQGGASNAGLSLLIKPLHLNNDEINQLVAFLNSLTGEILYIDSGP